MSVAALGYAAALTCGGASLAVVLALVALRLGRDRAERRRLHLRGPVWRQVLVLSSGEDEDLDDAYARLLAADAAERRAVEADAFALLAKLRGDARQRLREVLRAWGGAEGGSGVRSRSAVRRSRAYYRLGALAEPGSHHHLVRGIADRDFVARRTAMLGLGSFPDPAVVAPMVDAAVAEPRLRHDLLAALDRMGRPAVPALRDQLRLAREEVRADPAAGGRRGQLAAEGLGLVGALEAVPSLEAAMLGAPDEMRIACTRALGQLGARSSLTALAEVTDHPNPDVRRTAAQSLGLLGGPGPVPALTALLEDPSVEVARAAAEGLQRCGPAGADVLRTSAVPVAREVRALAALAGG